MNIVLTCEALLLDDLDTNRYQNFNARSTDKSLRIRVQNSLVCVYLFGLSFLNSEGNTENRIFSKIVALIKHGHHRQTASPI